MLDVRDFSVVYTRLQPIEQTQIFCFKSSPRLAKLYRLPRSVLMSCTTAAHHQIVCWVNSIRRSTFTKLLSLQSFSSSEQQLSRRDSINEKQKKRVGPKWLPWVTLDWILIKSLRLRRNLTNCNSLRYHGSTKMVDHEGVIYFKELTCTNSRNSRKEQTKNPQNLWF